MQGDLLDDATDRVAETIRMTPRLDTSQENILNRPRLGRSGRIQRVSQKLDFEPIEPIDEVDIDFRPLKTPERQLSRKLNRDNRQERRLSRQLNQDEDVLAFDTMAERQLSRNLINDEEVEHRLERRANRLSRHLNDEEMMEADLARQERRLEQRANQLSRRLAMDAPASVPRRLVTQNQEVPGVLKQLTLSFRLPGGRMVEHTFQTTDSLSVMVNQIKQEVTQGGLIFIRPNDTVINCPSTQSLNACGLRHGMQLIVAQA